MLLCLASAPTWGIWASMVAVAILCATMSGCEDSKQPPTSASLNAGAAPDSVKPAAPPTTAAEALIVRTRGPSDRPPPVLVFASDAAASKQALADLARTEPMGGTPVLVDPAEWKAMRATVGPVPLEPGAGAKLELEICGTSPRRVLLDGPAAAKWVDAAEACLAPDALGCGYLRSLRTTLPK